MKHRLLIRVCKKDIEAGQPDCDIACPIGLAMRRQLLIPANEFEVAKKWVRIKYERIALPPEVQEFIKKFDRLCGTHPGPNFHRHKHFAPFNFILDMTKKVIKQ